MSTAFHRYRRLAWSGLKCYFVEWRKRGLICRELRMLSDRQLLSHLRPLMMPDAGIGPIWLHVAASWAASARCRETLYFDARARTGARFCPIPSHRILKNNRRLPKVSTRAGSWCLGSARRMDIFGGNNVAQPCWSERHFLTGAS
jgi:hypothetical protein